MNSSAPATPDPSCCVDGCAARVIAKKRRLCSKHYARWHRHGDPLHVSHSHFYGTTEQRFWHYVDQRPDGHWIWTGPVNSSKENRSYGLLFDSDTGRNMLAHRYSYELHKGPIPEGLEPDHLCNIPYCVAPDCLEAVTHLENVRRGMLAYHARRRAL